jgi:hypothetical protein
MALSFSEWLLERKRPVSVNADVDAWLNSADNLKKDISVLKDLIDKKEKKKKDLDKKKPEVEPDQPIPDKDKEQGQVEKPEGAKRSDQPESEDGATQDNDTNDAAQRPQKERSDAEE